MTSTLDCAALGPCWGLRISGLSIPWELVRNADSQTSPQTYEIRISAGGSCAHLVLRNTGLASEPLGVLRGLPCSCSAREAGPLELEGSHRHLCLLGYSHTLMQSPGDPCVWVSVHPVVERSKEKVM